MRWLQVTPGPGHYEVPSAFRSGPTFTIAPRTPRKQLDTGVPGPGNYDQTVPVQPSGPAFTMSARIMELFKPTEGPGPGAYGEELWCGHYCDTSSVSDMLVVMLRCES
jgi:hypothetical protein